MGEPVCTVLTEGKRRPEVHRPGSPAVAQFLSDDALVSTIRFRKLNAQTRPICSRLRAWAQRAFA